MFRFIQKYFRPDYEPCAACEAYKNQLAITNHEKAEMLRTLLDLVRPIVTEVRPKTTDIEPILPKAVSFSRQRAALEEQARNTARTREKTSHRAVPDNELEAARLREELKKNIGALETELGIPKEKEEEPT